MSRIIRCSHCGGPANLDAICMTCTKHPAERNRKQEAEQARRQTEEWQAKGSKKSRPTYTYGEE